MARSLLDRQGTALSRLLDAAADQLWRAATDGRRELYERLSALSPTAPVTARLQAADLAALPMRARLVGTLEAAERAAHVEALAHTAAWVRHHEPQALIPPLPDLPLLSRYATERLAAQLHELTQRVIVAASAERLTPADLARRVAGPRDSALLTQRARVELVGRTEMARAFNVATLALLTEMDDDPSNPLLKRIEEYHDSRNHPFSRAADGRTAPVAEPFRVPTAEVAAAATAMKRRNSGVFWTVEGADYIGNTLPAHHNDRGRIVAWRSSWST